LPASSSLQDHKASLAHGLNSSSGVISSNWDSRNGLFASSPSKDDNAFESILTYYNSQNGNNPILDSDIRRTMVAKRYLALGSTTTGIDTTAATSSTRGFFSSFKGLVGNNSKAKDVVFTAANNASGAAQSTVERIQEAHKVIDLLQADFGASDEIAVQAKNANRADIISGNVTADEMLQLAQGYTRNQREIFAQNYNTAGNTATTSGLATSPVFVSELAGDSTIKHKKAMASLLFALPELIDATKTIGPRAIAVAGKIFSNEDAKILMNSVLGTLTTAINWTGSSNQKTHDLASVLNALYRTNTTEQMERVEVDASSAPAFTNAVALLFVAASSGPTNAFTSQISVNSNNFNNISGAVVQANLANVSLMTDIWYSNFLVAENSVSQFYKNPSFSNATFITAVGAASSQTPFLAQYSLVHYNAFADGNDELELTVGEALRSDGVSVPLMKNGGIRVFEIAPDGRTLSTTSAFRYFATRNVASKL
jgi:hypothetical protein